MKEILEKVVEKLFDSVPFSKKSEMLKEEVNLKLEEKFDENSKTKSEVKSLGEILNKCDNVKKTCHLLNCEYDESIVDNKNLISDKTIGKSIKLLKKYIILKCLLYSALLPSVLAIIFRFNINTLITYIISILIDLGIIKFVNIKLDKKYKELKIENKKFNNKGKQYIYDFYDKYSKKFLNCLMIDIAILVYLLIYSIYSAIVSRYTFFDITSQYFSMSFIMQVFLFFTLKHYFYRKVVSIYFTDTKNNAFKGYTKKVIKISCIYFLIVLTIILIFRNSIEYVTNTFLIFGIIYFFICLIMNLLLRKEYVFNNKIFTIKRIVTISLLIIFVSGYSIMNMDFFLTQPFINKVSNQLEYEDDITYNEENGLYTIITEKENFKILQLTDIHLGGSIFSYSKDIKALKACLKLIEATKPDFVVVTGDLVFPMGIMSLSLNNNAPVMQFAAFMRNTGIPWAFTYGNHDTESMSKLNKSDFNDLMKSLSYKTSHNLLYPYIQPDIYGRSNQRIEIRSKNDNKIMQEIYLIDSNDYIPDSKKINEYDYIRDDQVEWYKKSLLDIESEEGYMPSSMVFFHIPIKDYKKVNDLYEKGSDEVKYYYGVLGEKMIDKICTSKYDSKLFNTAVELGSTKAMFFGHDHYNNQSLEYKGIRLTYGYSIDYLVMPGIDKDTEQRGGTLITIYNDNTFDIEPYRLKDIN